MYEKIDNNISVENLINCFLETSEEFCSFKITKIIEKDKLKESDKSFLKWETASDDPIFLHDCFCKECSSYVIDFPEELIEETCSSIELHYYVTQQTTTIEGDSYRGELVYPCNNYYVFIDFSC